MLKHDFPVGQECLFLTNSKWNAKAVIQKIKQENYKCEHCSFSRFYSAGFYFVHGCEQQTVQVCT